jgi:hypothetical protein
MKREAPGYWEVTFQVANTASGDANSPLVEVMLTDADIAYFFWSSQLSERDWKSFNSKGASPASEVAIVSTERTICIQPEQTVDE